MGSIEVVLLTVVLISVRTGGGNEESGRQFYLPPPLVNPRGGTFKLIVGYAVPVQLSGRILVYGQNFQFQYGLAQNASSFSNSRRRRSKTAPNERRALYRLLEEDLARKGVDGRSCLKQDICESAAAPLKDEGLIGELLHLFLTPDYGNYGLMDREYLEAAQFGRNNEDCSKIYQCPTGQSVLDKISKVFSNL